MSRLQRSDIHPQWEVGEKTGTRTARVSPSDFIMIGGDGGCCSLVLFWTKAAVTGTGMYETCTIYKAAEKSECAMSMDFINTTLWLKNSLG